MDDWSDGRLLSAFAAINTAVINCTSTAFVSAVWCIHLCILTAKIFISLSATNGDRERNLWCTLVN